MKVFKYHELIKLKSLSYGGGLTKKCVVKGCGSYPRIAGGVRDYKQNDITRIHVCP